MTPGEWIGIALAFGFGARLGERAASAIGVPVRVAWADLLHRWSPEHNPCAWCGLSASHCSCHPGCRGVSNALKIGHFFREHHQAGTHAPGTVPDCPLCWEGIEPVDGAS